jgi:hypothetical protein
MKAITIILAVVFLFSCSSSKPQSQADQKGNTQKVCSEFDSSERERIVLLSIKYNVDEESIRTMLEERCVDGREVTRGTILKYAEKHGIPTPTISSILIDYKFMEEIR